MGLCSVCEMGSRPTVLGVSYMGLCSVCQLGSSILVMRLRAIWERVTWDYILCVKWGLLFWK